jgi:hypothetical protein
MSATGWVNAETRQKWDPWKLLNQVEEWVKAGIKVYSCYEAGACGYWYHRELVKRGAINYLVAPGPWRINPAPGLNLSQF